MILKWKTLAITFAGSALMMACQSNEFTESEDGFKYKIVRSTDGVQPQDGSYVQYNLLQQDETDSVHFDSKDVQSPTIIPCSMEQWKASGPFYKALLLLGEGDSAIFKIPTKTLFSESINPQVPAGINPEGEMTFYVGVQDIMIQSELEEMMARESEAQLEKDIAAIESYLDDQGIQAESTESGLYYVIEKEGSGGQPQAGDKVNVHYTGTLLDGTKFDSSLDRGEPFAFNVGQGMVIRGWDEGIPLLREGGKATLYIPSTLAYGNRAAGPVIKPNSNLKFEVELISIGDE